MQSIIDVLNNRYPLMFDMSKVTKANSFTVVPFLEYDLLRSVHDFTHVDDAAVITNLDKYTRRYSRLIETIKTEKEIVFIRHNTSTDFNENDIILFYDTIRRINKSLNIRFILITTDNDLTVSDTLTRIGGFKLIKIADPTTLPSYTGFTSIVYSFVEVLKDISGNI